MENCGLELDWDEIGAAFAATRTSSFFFFFQLRLVLPRWIDCQRRNPTTTNMQQSHPKIDLLKQETKSKKWMTHTPLYIIENMNSCWVWYVLYFLCFLFFFSSYCTTSNPLMTAFWLWLSSSLSWQHWMLEEERDATIISDRKRWEKGRRRRMQSEKGEGGCCRSSRRLFLEMITILQLFSFLSSFFSCIIISTFSEQENTSFFWVEFYFVWVMCLSS